MGRRGGASGARQSKLQKRRRRTEHKCRALRRRRQDMGNRASAMATSETESSHRGRRQRDRVAAMVTYDTKTDIRWDSAQSDVVQTTDLLGDHLAMELRAAVQAGKGGKASRTYRKELSKTLREYENESRLLIKLADTGRVVQVLERAIHTVLGLLRCHLSGVVASWLQYLQDERRQRVALYEALLADEDRLRAELGSDQDHEEIQTLLKHGIEKYGTVLTPGELDVMAAAFKASVEMSGIVVMRTPDWFTTTIDAGRFGVEKSALAGGEERCLREASMWSKLHHPNVRKFYGACHVGEEPYLLHEELWGSSFDGWESLVGYARGLLFLHEQGIVHKELSQEAFMQNGGGVLSGLGLARVSPVEGMPHGSCREFTSTNERSDATLDDQRPSKPRDVKAFSTCCFQMLVTHRASSTREVSARESMDFPSTKPSVLSNEEWRLLQSMHCTNPVERLSMLDIVHEMEILAKREHLDNPPYDPEGVSEDVNDVRHYVVVIVGQTLAQMLEEASLICDKADNKLAAVHQPVCGRLLDVYKQLVQCSSPLPLQMVERFGGLVTRFILTLERKTSGGYSCGILSSQSVAGSLCASRTVAARNYGLHYDIDRFLHKYASLGLDDSGSLHAWKPSWEAVQRQQRQKLARAIANPETILEGVESDAEVSETLALLQFERQNAGLTSVGRSLPALPPWYIAPHRVQLGKHLADGSFGSMYEGTYEETPVVVKVLPTELTPEARRQFIQEADVWFSLEHMFVLKLYGACHEGHPFFVCEPAMEGTIVKALERGGNTWMYLLQTGLGLQHLHDHIMVHANLKGSSILVTGSGGVKLADFGLSFNAHKPTSTVAADSRALCASRWNAPEVLRGEKPTLASDIYSFGMLIIEAVTGELPWGSGIPDAAVKHNVVHERLLPQRPATFSDGAWDLVTRMCSYDPDNRLTIGAVLAILTDLRELQRRSEY